MDGDVSNSQSDQISLYGLFGDMTTTLQGLNDHLSPSSLQQSPPCGSTLPTQTMLSKLIFSSPNKVNFGGSQQGVLLSDLADHSPSAGSVTVASLCSHVSFDNLRCTYLVNQRGNRFCSQHTNEVRGVTIPWKEMMQKPAPSTSVKKTVTFTPTVTNLKDFNHISNRISSTMLSTTRAMKPVKLDVKSVTSGTFKAKSVDVPESSNIASERLPESRTDKIRQNQFCFVRKVGKQITVTSRPLEVKETEASVVKPVQTVSNILSPRKTGIATSSLSNSIPRIVMKTESAKTSTTKAPKTSSVSNAKANGTDEDVLKKVVEVLNSRSDLTSQQQILLLQSMGITVVHGLQAGGNSTARKKRPSKPMVRKVITIGNAKTLQSSSSTSIEPTYGVTQTVTSGFSQIPSISVNFTQNTTNTLPPIHPLPSAMETLARRAVSTVQLPPPYKKVRLSLSPLKGDVPSAMESLARQAVTIPQISEYAGKNIKVETKASQRRKQKLPGVGAAKKNKSVHDEQSQQLTTSVQQTASDAKKVKHPKTCAEKSKQQKRNPNGKSMKSSFLTANSPPRMLHIPPSSRDCVVKLARHLNEKAVLDYTLFESEAIERDEKVEPDRHKTLKSKLLKKHISKKRKTTSGTVFNYEKCIKDLKGTDFIKAFYASKDLLNLLRSQSNGTRTKVHHEKILNDLMNQTNAEYEDLLEENMPNCASHAITDANGSGETSTFTLGTVHLRNECNRLVEQMDQEERELKMIFECYEDDPTSTKKLFENIIEAKNDTKHSMHRIGQTIVKRCHLSSDSGLGCTTAALPYASYCRQHMWCCQSQRLYKLDQNMKPAADITPEPLVKKARKRTKLLPLIKRYKKKKKRKIDGSDGHYSANGQQTVQSGAESAGSNTQSTQRILSPLTGRSGLVSKNIETHVDIDNNSDIEVTKPFDTSEEDLNLTTNEIMLSGMLDKLPDDPHDFDLFTTDKGAEELERALMLAATSPAHEHEEAKLHIPEFDSILLSSAKLNTSPSAIINCDAPKSNGQPPSLDSFNKSQCVHYTFGSRMPGALADKIENQASVFDREDEAVPSLISAEDLQDIEGVLERLHAEDVNSPKLPSSPAIDQYTSMLARQLSQEAETESLKQQSTSTGIPNMHSSFDMVKENTMLSRSYSLPTSSIPDTPLADKGGTLMKEPTNNHNGIVSRATELRQPADFTQKIARRCSGNGPSNAVFEAKGTPSVRGSVPSSLRTTTTSQDLISKVPLSMTQVVSTVDRSSMQATSTRSIKKVTATPSMKVPTQSSIPWSPRSSQPKISLSSTVVPSPVLPVTLMQSPSQSGNVIKVIVPPGTMVNGTNGQQNMLLIPVSALMKQNTVHGNQNIPTGMIPGISNQNLMPTVKTQLSSLQAGQQFFIVNNHTGTTQPHLALLQKPAICSTQQGVFEKSVRKFAASQKDDCANQFQSSLKPNLNECLKQHKAAAQHVFPTTSAVGSKSSGVIARNMHSEVSQSNNFLNMVGKMTTQQRIGRRGKNPAKKVKAKFDPVAKKYISMTSSTASAPVVQAPVPTSLATSVDLNLTENLKKFNASALSIQSKVQQIDSVLSSLNAARNTQQISKQLVNGHVEKKVKTSRSITTITERLGVVNPSPYALVQTPVAVSVPSSLQISSTTVQGKDVLTVMPREMQLKRQKAAIAKQNKTTLKKTGILAVSTNSTCSKASDLTTAQTSVPVSSGTVHWNQTTTAGPVITTTTLTVPVYITGAITAGTWHADLAIKGSLAGSTLPVILPAHKISPHCQLPQRVLLGSIGSLAVHSQVVSSASASTVLQRTRTIITPTSLPLNVGRCRVSVGQKLSVGSYSPTQQIGKSALQNFNRVLPSLRRSEGHAPVEQKASPASRSSCVVTPMAHDDSMAKKKSGRKASHDTILHDPLMYDPTTFDCSSPDGS